MSLIDKNLQRLHWRCRRGMLELDLLLIPFFEQSYQQLTKSEQADFQQLLEQADPQLYDWLLGVEIPKEQHFAQIVARIRQHAKIS